MSMLFERLRDGGQMPSLSSSVGRLLMATAVETASAVEVASVLVTDGPTATRILRYASTNFGGAARKPASLQQAVSLVGTRGVRLLAATLSFAARDRCDHGGPALAEGFSYPRHWNRALLSALAARALARLGGGKVQPDEAFAAGFFARVGQLVLASALPAEYGEVLLAWRSSTSDLLAIERARLGDTHVEIGARWLLHAGLPATLAEAVRQLERDAAQRDDAARAQTEPPPLPTSALGDVVAVADLIGQLASDDTQQTTPRIERALAFASRAVGLEPGAWHRLVGELAQARRDFLAHLPATPVESKMLTALFAETRDQLAELQAAAQLEASGARGRQQEELHRASTDRASGCGNRAAFDERLELELLRAQRTTEPLALLLVTLEPLSSIAEKQSAGAADLVLRAVSDALLRVLRRIDFLARFGATELAILATQCDAEGARHLAERVRTATASAHVEWRGTSLGVKACVGGAIAAWPDAPSTSAALVAAADEALYAARRQGVDSVRVLG